MYNNRYDILGCGNTDVNADKLYCDNFHDGYEHFKSVIQEMVETSQSATFYKFSDGEFLFMQGIENGGSTSPGCRDTNIGATKLELAPFREGVVKNDFYMVESYQGAHAYWNNTFKDRPFNAAAEWVYGLVANRWFFKKFKGQIGLIGAKEKLELIQELLEYKEYRDYLGIDKFEDYICVPQRYACDDIKSTGKLVEEQLRNAKSKIFLEGIGHAKQALLWKMKQFHPAVYITVGSGICALAGVQDCIGRPYFADWKNFRIEGYDYSKIDIWKESGLEDIIWLNKNK
tara:strand:- start:1118 stop:1978 length:861 start_codon:yes stop_codon:yes gene_type:complete